MTMYYPWMNVFTLLGILLGVLGLVHETASLTCGAGTYDSQGGATVCTTCPTNTYSNAGATACSALLTASFVSSGCTNWWCITQGTAITDITCSTCTGYTSGLLNCMSPKAAIDNDRVTYWNPQCSGSQADSAIILNYGASVLPSVVFFQGPSGDSSHSAPNMYIAGSNSASGPFSTPTQSFTLTPTPPSYAMNFTYTGGISAQYWQFSWSGQSNHMYVP